MQRVHHLCSLGHGWFRSLKTDTQGWMICGAVLLTTLVRSGITYSFGIFVVELKKDYNKSMTMQNWIGTLSFCISLVLCPFTVLFIRMIGKNGYQIAGLSGTLILSVSCIASSYVNKEEWMFLTHSLLYGLGSSLHYMASSLVIADYFDKDHPRHVLATSILLCGYPIGSLIFNPINGYIVSHYSWRTGFRSSATLVFITGVICSSIMMPKVDEPTEEMPIELSSSNFRNQMFKYCKPYQLRARPEIALWLVGNMLSFIGFFMPFVNLAFYMDLDGISVQRSSLALMVLSLCECFAYISASLVGDIVKGKLVYLNILAASGISAVCFTWPSMTNNYTSIVVSSGIMGAFLGLTIVYQYAASAEVTKLPLDVAWSATNLWSGIGILIGPIFSGAVFDSRKNYHDVFLVSGILYLIQIFLFGSIPLIQFLRSRGSGMFQDYDELEGGDIKEYIGSNPSNLEDALAKYGGETPSEVITLNKSPTGAAFQRNGSAPIDAN